MRTGLGAPLASGSWSGCVSTCQHARSPHARWLSLGSLQFWAERGWRHLGGGHIGSLTWLRAQPASEPCGRCRPNVAGRRCDTCAPGFHGYPSCRSCDCHEAGSAPGTCDPLTGQCYCKVRAVSGPGLPPLPPSRLTFAEVVHPFGERGASQSLWGRSGHLWADGQHRPGPPAHADCLALLPPGERARPEV